jgi:hypothetical protein
MGLLSNYSNYKYADFSKKLTANDTGLPRTSSYTLFDVSVDNARVRRADLETLYRTDAMTYKIVNTYKQLIIQAGYRILADNKGDQKQYDNFFEFLGKIGMHYKLDQLLARIIHDCVLYGYAFIERVYDETGRYIVDLKPIDAKLIDYVRDMKFMLMTNEEQNPLGYVMNVSYYSDAIGDPYPQGARVLPSYIFLRPERIAAFMIGDFGHGFEGMGLVEPAYNQITRKMEIEKAASNAIYNAADSLIYATVGNETKSPSNPLMNATLDTLKNFTTNKRAVFAYPTELKTLPVEQSPQVRDFLKYLREEQAAAAGMSYSLALGTGESNNKSTMNTERRDFNTKLNSIARVIAEQFNTKILDALYKVNEYNSKAMLVFNNVSTDDKEDVINQMMNLAKMNALTTGEVREYAKNVLDLDTDDEEWEKLQKSLEYLPNMPNQSGTAAKNPQQPISGANTPKPGVKKNIAKSKDNYEASRE